jgi:hypothetical protein
MRTLLAMKMVDWIGQVTVSAISNSHPLPFIFNSIRTGAGRPVIPKRGEKDFEPSAGGGSGLQLHVLDRARSAMFNALKATPSASR